MKLPMACRLELSCPSPAHIGHSHGLLGGYELEQRVTVQSSGPDPSFGSELESDEFGEWVAAVVGGDEFAEVGEQ